ncbi:MAG: hypothetical protein ABSB32_05105 [Thermodesulfobacteriota bacterium]
MKSLTGLAADLRTKAACGRQERGCSPPAGSKAGGHPRAAAGSALSKGIHPLNEVVLATADLGESNPPSPRALTFEFDNYQTKF